MTSDLEKRAEKVDKDKKGGHGVKGSQLPSPLPCQ